MKMFVVNGTWVKANGYGRDTQSVNFIEQAETEHEVLGLYMQMAFREYPGFSLVRAPLITDISHLARHFVKNYS